MTRVVIHNHLSRDADKFSHKEVNYGPSKTGKDRCEVCKNIRVTTPLSPECVFVQSPISYTGWCRLFDRKGT